MSDPDQRFFQLLWRHAAFALIATDVELRIHAWNVQASRMFGQTSAEMMGRSILDIFPDADRDTASQALTRALTDGQTSQFEVERRDPAGQRSSLFVRIGPVVDEGGRRIGTVANITDITERVELERRLASSERMASLGSLAGGVAHHFNSILGGLVTAVDHALSVGDLATCRRTLAQAADALGRATRITENLLAFSRGDTRIATAAGLREVLLSFAGQIEPRLAEANVTLDLQVEDVPAVEVPTTRMMQVLENLTDNAVDAMPTGGTLTLHLHHNRTADLVELRVIDTGSGIPDDVVDHVFEPFYTTKGELAGGQSNNVGLGLAVAHGLVGEMGGSIDVASTPGRGSCFTIRFDASRKPPEPLEPPAPSP